MKTTFVEGNAIDYVLDHDDAILIHVCNNYAVMGSGIALEIKNRIPTTFENYVLKSLETENVLDRLGHISFSSELNVCNMTCQDSYGEGTRHLHYGYLIDCLQELSFFIKHTHKEIKRVVLPYKMGADRAGGDWETVIEIVQHVFKNIVDEVVVVKFKQ